VSDGVIKLAAGAAIAALIGVGIWAGVRKLRSSAESAVDEAITRPYPSPSRLVIAAVTSDYASEALADGAIVLRHVPDGSAAGLAGWYGAEAVPAKQGLVEDLVASIADQPTYRPLEAPAGPCRSDADVSTTTLGELVFGDERNVTVWTCSVTKNGNAYLLAWAARSTDVETDQRKLVSMLKRSQLVSNKLCSVNVINGGCMPDPPRMLAALVENARR
jgi:hypothetical protein